MEPTCHNPIRAGAVDGVSVAEFVESGAVLTPASVTVTHADVLRAVADGHGLDGVGTGGIIMCAYTLPVDAGLATLRLPLDLTEADGQALVKLIEDVVHG